MDAKLIRRLCFWSIGSTTLVFALALISVCLYQRDRLKEEAEREAKSDLYMASNLFCDRLKIAKTAIVNSSLPHTIGESRQIVENLLQHNHDIYGTAIALKPKYVKKCSDKDRFMIYSYRTHSDTLHTFLISDSIENFFHYPERDWYKYPIETGKAHWSEPYYDSLTSKTLMVSYSAPMVMPDSTIIGVMLVDITLTDGIRSIVEEVDSKNDHRTYLLSRKGQLVFGDTTDMANNVVYTQQLAETKWTLGHIIDKDTLYRPLQKMICNMSLFFIFTVIIICITIYYVISLVTRPAVKRQMRIKAELDVAANIQEGMLPKMVPSFPNRNDIDIATMMQPAKEVGGDFYNYFIEGENLYFIIGDVSGKGVPAAIIMAITTELFTFLASKKSDPAEIVTNINKVINRDNQESMFVTMIVGIFNIKTSKMKICNAGHNPPILITRGKEKILKLETNLPTGVIDDYPYCSEEFDFPSDSKLVLYTDGVTEAENARHQQFGESQLVQVVHENRSANAHQLRSAIESAVHKFTSGYEQSDDIALLILHLLPS